MAQVLKFFMLCLVVLNVSFIFFACQSKPLKSIKEPISVAGAIQELDDIFRYQTYAVKDPRISASTLIWKEQVHTPKLAYKQDQLDFSNIEAVQILGKEAPGWKVKVETKNREVIFKVEEPEVAQNLKRALEKLSEENRIKSKIID